MRPFQTNFRDISINTIFIYECALENTARKLFHASFGAYHIDNFSYFKENPFCWHSFSAYHITVNFGKTTMAPLPWCEMCKMHDNNFIRISGIQIESDNSG